MDATLLNRNEAMYREISQMHSVNYLVSQITLPSRHFDQIHTDGYLRDRPALARHDQHYGYIVAIQDCPMFSNIDSDGDGADRAPR